VVKVLDIKTPASGEMGKNLWSNLEHLKPHDEINSCCATSGLPMGEQVADRAQVGAALCGVVFACTRPLAQRRLAEWILRDRYRCACKYNCINVVGQQRDIEMKRAVVLLFGRLDSATVLAMAVRSISSAMP